MHNTLIQYKLCIISEELDLQKYLNLKVVIQ